MPDRSAPCHAGYNRRHRLVVSGKTNLPPQLPGLASCTPVAGMLSFRHDMHRMLDFSFLDCRIENLIAASCDIEDPAFSTNITGPMATDWIKRTIEHSFIDPALHNESSISDPSTARYGTGLFEHVRYAAKNLGFSVCPCGRHCRRPQAPGNHRRTLQAFIQKRCNNIY